MSCFLGLDTSNYKTSAAIYNCSTGFARNEGRFLDVAHGELGLRQSDALFQHVKALPDVLEKLDISGNPEVCAVGYSAKPRNVEGSYMPCFLAGEMAAKCIAQANGIKAHAFSHQQGHIAAALFSAGKLDLLQREFLSWHISGGTTELLKISPSAQNIFEIEIIGGSQDCAAGQIIDRAGVALGLDFPCGAQMDLLAQNSTSTDYFVPKNSELYFSISGVQNKYENLIEKAASAADIAAFTINSITAIIWKITQIAAEKYNLPILFSGGVSSSTQMQKKFAATQQAVFAKGGYGGDNALGAAVLAAITEGEII